MRRKIGVVVVAIVAILVPAALAAQDVVTITPPTIVAGSTPFGFAVEDAINTELRRAAERLELEINTEIAPYIGQDDLALGFANAGATAAHVGTQRSFNDYRRFALTIGTGFSLSAPSSDPAVIEDAVNDIENEGDIYFGAVPPPIAAALGINMGRFVEDLYATLKVGYVSLPSGNTIAEEFSFDYLSVGVLFDYQLLETRQLPLGFLRWRGLTLGSGVIYQRNESEFRIDVPIDPVTTDPIALPAPAPTLSAQLEVEPKLTLGASSSSWSIPLEATTGLRILWLVDVNFGAGIDLAFGSSDITVDVESPVRVSENSGADLQFTDGSVGIDAGTDGDGPQLVRPRLTAGVRFNLGPLKLDIPLMYYFDSEGNSAMLGINVGIVW